MVWSGDRGTSNLESCLQGIIFSTTEERMLWKGDWWWWWKLSPYLTLSSHCRVVIFRLLQIMVHCFIYLVKCSHFLVLCVDTDDMRWWLKDTRVHRNYCNSKCSRLRISITTAQMPLLFIYLFIFVAFVGDKEELNGNCAFWIGFIEKSAICKSWRRIHHFMQIEVRGCKKQPLWNLKCKFKGRRALI